MRHPTVARSTPATRRWRTSTEPRRWPLLTVGTGALLVGQDVVGERAAVDLAWILWVAGTIGGLFTAVSIPI